MQHKVKSAMIFAAGKGTRMAPLTDRMPKALVEVAGRPLIDHALDLTDEAGIGNVAVNTHHFPDALETHLAGREVKVIRERTLLETGGGLRNALPVLGDDPVITLNSDAVWTKPNPLRKLLDAWDPARMDALLALIRPSGAIGHKGAGDFELDDEGRIHRARDMIYSGAQIIRTERLRSIPESVFSLNALWDILLREQSMFGLVYSGRWCDVGRPDCIPLAEAMLNN